MCLNIFCDSCKKEMDFDETVNFIKGKKLCKDCYAKEENITFYPIKLNKILFNEYIDLGTAIMNLNYVIGEDQTFTSKDLNEWSKKTKELELQFKKILKRTSDYLRSFK